MRRPSGTARVAAMALVGCFALAPGAAASPDAAMGPVVAGAAGRAAELSDVYLVRWDAVPESLLAEAGFGALDSTRRWPAPELESAALRLRDLLARRGDALATVRLSLVRGRGSAPGTAV